jgi:hypothetical protein
MSLESGSPRDEQSVGCIRLNRDVYADGEKSILSRDRS